MRKKKNKNKKSEKVKAKVGDLSENSSDEGVIHDDDLNENYGLAGDNDFNTFDK